MRFVLMLAAACALTACDSGAVPTPLERQQAGSVGAANAANEDALLLLGNGIKAGKESFIFSDDLDRVDKAIETKLGAGMPSKVNRDCGAGPMQFIRYPGGLSANFMNGALVGWNIAEASELMAVAGDVQLGMKSADAAAASGYLAIEGSTLGEEFVVSDSIGGFIEDGEVSMLYAGVQCFFR